MAIPNTDVRWFGSYFPTELLKTFQHDDSPIINSAEQPYDAQAIPWNYETIGCVFFTDTLDLNARKGWTNRRNSATFWGFAVDELLLARWEFRLLYRADNAAFIRNQVEIWVTEGGWKCRLPDYGTVELETPGNQDPKIRYAPILFKGDIPGTNVALDGSGNFKTDQTTIIINDAFFHKPIDFTTITPLPQQLPTALGGP